MTIAFFSFFIFIQNHFMHQFLSAVASIVLSPFNWIVVLLIAAYFIRKKNQKKVFIILSVCLFLVFGNHWLLNGYVDKWQPGMVSPTSLSLYSCGIVPGGFASPAENNGGYFNASADRFIQAVKLYKMGKIQHLLISGGNAKTDNPAFREAAWVKNELIQFGVPDSLIFFEDHSNNTNENAINSKRILDSLHLLPPYLLISSAFHLPRAKITFQNAGLPVDAFPCNYSEGMDSFSWDDLLPRPSVLLDWDRYLKEAVGYFWYKLK